MGDAAVPRALTIAASDSGGGAGIEADLKTFSAFGVFGMVALTSVTAQNTVEVAGIHDLPPEFAAKQIDLVAEDIGVDAAKTGMLSAEPIVCAVADSVRKNGVANLVVDPVMVAKSGDALLQVSARQALIERLLPLALVVTPNVPEAEVISGMSIDGEESLREAARRIVDLGPRWVLMKGGHLEGTEAVDCLCDGEQFLTYSAPRIDTKNTHGTGCTFSAAITACLAQGDDVPAAVSRAKDYLTEAIRCALPLGHGHGPLNHHWQQDS